MPALQRAPGARSSTQVFDRLRWFRCEHRVLYGWTKGAIVLVAGVGVPIAVAREGRAGLDVGATEVLNNGSTERIAGGCCGC